MDSIFRKTARPIPQGAKHRNIGRKTAQPIPNEVRNTATLVANNWHLTYLKVKP
jgi:hypothetical protein